MMMDHTNDFELVNAAITDYANSRNLCWLNYSIPKLGGGFECVSALLPVLTLGEFSVIYTDPSKLLDRAVVHAFGTNTVDARFKLALAVFIEI